jgi:hypothetical protein
VASLTPNRRVQIGFECDSVRLQIADIRPLRLISEALRKTAKYRRIAASIEEIGFVEPPVVARDRNEPGKYLLLDGHIRLEILKEQGEIEVVCLVSLDDEAFTYNKRVSRITVAQEHKMIREAVERGISDERIARTLNVDVSTIRRKRLLLNGVCPEAADLLKDQHASVHVFCLLKKMLPLRQIESAQLMVAMNNFSLPYAKALLAATPKEQLVGGSKRVDGMRKEQIALMERESDSLQREFKLAEQSYSADHLDLVLMRGYLSSLLANTRVTRYLAQHQAGILREFQRMVDVRTISPEA